MNMSYSSRFLVQCPDLYEVFLLVECNNSKRKSFVLRSTICTRLIFLWKEADIDHKLVWFVFFVLFLSVVPVSM
jgi:hypothetical protein